MSFSTGKSEARRERARTRREEARRTAGIARVNELFGTPGSNGMTSPAAQRNANMRKELMDRLFSDVLGYHKNDIQRTGDISARNLKFNLARTGNLGGSVDVDKNAELANVRTRALLDATNRAEGARLNAGQADEQTRMDLIRQISSGLDANIALDAGGRALQQNLQDAKFNAQASSLGDAFASFAEGLPYATLSQQDPGVYYRSRPRRPRYGESDTGVYVSG